jgi:acyl-CoA thioesterase FadM
MMFDLVEGLKGEVRSPPFAQLKQVKIQSPDYQELYITAQVPLVVIDRVRGKIMRQLPSPMKDTLSKLVL